MNKNKSKFNSNNNLLNIIWIISIWFVFVLAIFSLKYIDFIELDNIDKNNSISNSNSKNTKNPEKLKDENKINKLNILLVWRWWVTNDAPNLTDTIILAKFNRIKKNISLLSIPRDLYVKENKFRYGKINEIYAKNLSSDWTNEEAMQILEEKITEITWEKINYFINVDFDWFKEIIDTIWWITIDVPKKIVDYKYPDWNWWYQTIKFEKWISNFNWEKALQYARTRKSTSDFDRSIRQQQVIEAVKNKLTWTYLIKDPSKIKSLYDIFNKNVSTDITFTKTLKFAYDFNLFKWFKFYSSNMNDSCSYWKFSCEKWWIIYFPQRSLFNGMAVALIDWTYKWNLSNYEKSQKYANIVLNYPNLWDKNIKINVYNSVRISNLAWSLSNKMKIYWFNFPQKNYIKNTSKIFEKSVIYYNGISENSDTIKALKEIYDWEFEKVEKSQFLDKNTQTWKTLEETENINIEIVIWKDYKDKFKDLK